MRIIIALACAVAAWQVYVRWTAEPEPEPKQREAISRIIVVDANGSEHTYWSK